MRPINHIARERFDVVISKKTDNSVADLATSLDISTASVRRILNAHPHTVKIGTTKGARYALRKAVRNVRENIPVYAINESGEATKISGMDVLSPQGSYLPLTDMQWPSEIKHNGVWDGLAYPLYDMRPQGFLGARLASSISQDFSVPNNPNKWSDDDIVYVLSIRGGDCSGNLIIGEAAYQLWVNKKDQQKPIIDALNHYPKLADSSTNQFNALSIAGAGGEFPKFTTQRLLADSKTPHVIVKFTGKEASDTTRRWSDLLVCEHLALQSLSENTTITAASSRIIQSEGRTFFEVERFDRIGDFGRSPMISLEGIANAFIGDDLSWPQLTQKLIEIGLTDESVLNDVLVAWHYGNLIQNSDMHTGNLSFTFDRGVDSPSLDISPIYDMLPMRYAPLSSGEVPNKSYEIKRPPPDEQWAWEIALKAAQSFWLEASQDDRISQPFRDICSENHKILRLELPDRKVDNSI